MEKVKDPTMVSNGGSAIGEAIGDILEAQVHKLFRDIERELNCLLLTTIGQTKSGARSKKLLLKDRYGNEYNMDGVFIDNSCHPLILIESKYIRYKKHNRDKASWICHAHSAVRKNYPSIRASIAVLAGSWSATSVAMLTTNDINYFIIPFNVICDILAKRNVDFKWEEKDKEKAMTAWLEFSKLTEDEKYAIGEEMISIVKDDVVETIFTILDDTVPRELRQVVLELHTNKGETFTYVFDTKEEAVEFLNDFNNDFDENMFVSLLQI